MRNLSPNALYVDLLHFYLQTDTLIKADILNLPLFNRNTVSNMVMFYKTMLVSSRTLQMNDYIVTNHKILEELRKEYHLH